MFPNLAYIWCVCGAEQHKQQEPISSSQDVAAQAPAGFTLKSQLQTQGKLRYAQVTSPRHGQSPVGGESGEEGAWPHPGLSPSDAGQLCCLPMLRGRRTVFCTKSHRAGGGITVSAVSHRLTFPTGTMEERVRAGSLSCRRKETSWGYVASACAKEAFALIHAYRPQN